MWELGLKRVLMNGFELTSLVEFSESVCILIFYAKKRFKYNFISMQNLSRFKRRAI
jgi:hypothetical protein